MQTGQTGASISVLIDSCPRVGNWAPGDLYIVRAKLGDWRSSSFDYLQGPGQEVDRKVRCFDFKFTLVDAELYHRTTDDLLLKYLTQSKLG